MDWKAKWIWDSSGEHPRNHWVCFRKVFDLKEQWEAVTLHITADSRYFLYINGEKVGFGPVRCWNHEQSYDSYEIGHRLRPGLNCLAILVVHYGVSTFQYIEGRGGLLAQMEFFRNGNILQTIGSDQTWKTEVHRGYLENTMKICAQQAWSEVYDASRFNSDWISNGYNDSAWQGALEIGDVGMSPWQRLLPRDIPFLTAEKIYPCRVESYKEVQPVKNSICINLRNALFGAQYDANPHEFTAYICFYIFSRQQMKGEIVFPFTGWQSPRGDIEINGRAYPLLKNIGEQGVCQDDGYKLEVVLEAGYNLFVMDISGKYHEFGVMIAFNFENEINFMPFTDFAGSRCLILGPFESVSKYDTGHKVTENINYEDKAYQLCGRINSLSDLLECSQYITPLDDEFILENQAYPMVTVKKTLIEKEVTPELQNLVIADRTNGTVINPSETGIGDIELIIDFGKEMSGFIGFEIDAPKNTIIDLYLFECLNHGVVENTKDLDNTLRYIAGGGRQSYESPVRRGFRYLMLTIRNMKQPCRIYSLNFINSTYPVTQVGRFACSDYKLNKIWEMSGYTAQLCMEDTFVDCPAYEQTFWVGDGRTTALINYYTFGSNDIVKRCLRLVTGSAGISGYLIDQVPSGWQSIIPDWTFFWISACVEYYKHSKDLVFLKEIYPHLRKTLFEYEKRINPLGLFEFHGWNLLDWAPMDTPNSGVVTHQNVVLVKAIRDVADVALILEEPKEAERLHELGERIKGAINDHLWSEKKRAYIDCIHENGERSEVISQQTNILVYLYDCYQPEREKDLLNILLNCPADFVKIGSPFMSFFYLEALLKMGEGERALNYIRDWWGLMLDFGASTCWETFPGFEKGRLTRSHCHAWSAAPGYFLGAWFLGLRPETPGFEKLIVEPKPCGLKWAKGSIPVPDGRVDLEWRLDDSKLSIQINTPESYKINLKVDRQKWGVDEVWLNGRKVESLS